MRAVGVDRRPRFDATRELAHGELRPLAWKLRRRLGALDDVRCLRALGVELEQNEVDGLLVELSSAPELAAALASDPARRFFGRTRGVAEMLGLDGTGRGRALFLYVAVRTLRPRTVVETGCFSGWDSTVLLTALARNGEGSLCTIDLPPQDVPLGSEMPPLPVGLQPGFLVPDSLSHQWDLRLADARTELPRALSELERVDFFFHDSDHSYSHTVWELASAWRYLRRGGILVADDVSWNTAVWDFARGVGGRVAIRRGTPNVAALAKGPGVSVR